MASGGPNSTPLTYIGRLLLRWNPTFHVRPQGQRVYVETRASSWMQQKRLSYEDRPWNELPREMVESPSLESFNTLWDMAQRS